ncbi:MAG TPA: TraR/DksA family transcriptional regulator [Acidimicrobiales bacterium]|nr:TraR/DksA family transcriptional regulator [Acidimicrobiales bacterium]
MTPRLASVRTPLSPLELERFLRRLAEERQNKIEQLGAKDDMLAGADPVVVVALEARARETIIEIDRALARLEAGTYGSCERCERTIPLARLETIAYARWCFRCQDERETSLRW